MSKVLNLTFHGIGEPRRPLEPGEEAIWLKASEFERALDAVRARDDVRLTFDDGNLSDVTIGLPALLQRGLQAEFFVLAGRLGHPGFLAVADVRRLVESGMTIGSHGMHHRQWPRLDDQALAEEIVDARTLLEDATGRRVVRAACPFGKYDRRVLSRLRRGGFERVFTSDCGLAHPDGWLQPRNSVMRTQLEALEARQFAMGASGASALLRTVRLAVKRWR